MKWLIVHHDFDNVQARSISEGRGCAGWINGIPPVWSAISEDQSWKIPCVVVQDQETGEITGWFEL